MSYHILYEACPWHVRCALFDDHGRLLSLRFDDSSRKLIEGAVVWGRVRVIEKSLGAAFVSVGDIHDGLLPLHTLPAGHKLTQGQGVLVRVTRAGFGEKGPRLDGRVAHQPPVADSPCPQILVPAQSALVRALHDANAQPVTVWILNAHARDRVAQVVPERAVRQLNQDDSFADWPERLDSALDAMVSEQPKFEFSGGNLIVELTSAVATIDVNGGPLHMLNQREAALAINLSAAEEVARLCRLLDLGGSVIVDFITPKSKAHRDMIHDHLVASLQTTDEKFVEARPMSRHGLLEINRERRGPSLTLLLKTPAYVAGRIGLELWRTPAGANPKLIQQEVVAHPKVIEALRQHLTQHICLSHLGRHITLRSDAELRSSDFHING